MKKLLLMALLVLALVVTAVACDKTPDAPADTTAPITEASTEDVTEAPTEDVTEGSTEEVTTEEVTTEEVTEEVTTEEVTEEVTTEEVTEEVTEPEAPKSFEVDLTTVTATGSWPTVDAPVNGAALGLTGDEHVIALHYGSINLGEMDLSQYSKVTVTYITPTGELNGSNFNDEYEATGKRVLLMNAPSAVQDGTLFELLPAEDAIITSTHYDMSPNVNQVMTAEIDLSAIDYNGETYLTFDARNANNEFGAIGYLVYVIGIVFA